VQWVQPMFNSRRSLEQTLFPTALASGALIVAGYLLLSGQFPPWKGIGFLAGLLCGFVSFAVGVVRRKRGSRQPALRAVELLFSPLGFVVLLPFDVALAGGFFLGGVASFCMAWAVGSISGEPTDAAIPDEGDAKHGSDQGSSG